MELQQLLDSLTKEERQGLLERHRVTAYADMPNSQLVKTMNNRQFLTPMFYQISRL